MSQHISVGDFKIENLLEDISFEKEQTSQRKTSSGTGTLYIISGPASLKARVTLIRWRNGDSEVRGLPDSEPERHLSRLSKGLRMSIYHYHKKDVRWMELSYAKITSRGPQGLWSKPRKISFEELSRINGFDVDDELRKHGALEVGLRRSLLKDNSSRKNFICVTFRQSNTWLPVLVFACTRVIPMFKDDMGPLFDKMDA